jgi:hypothetical protein
MIAWKAVSLLSVLPFLLLTSGVLAQGQTTGRIDGTVSDERGAVIAGAEVTVVSRTTGSKRNVITDAAGSYTVPLVAPGIYQASVTASGFKKELVENVVVVITETTHVNFSLKVGSVIEELVSVRVDPTLIQKDGPQLGRVVDSRAVSELPLATRNLTQILGLSPGTAVDLPDNTAVGRNSQSISVNGVRTTQNNYQINGIDSNNIRSNNLQGIAVPAPETIQEFKVQTSLYDATFGRSAGGNIQAITRSGANEFHGAAY